jgi:hypothetical protein
MSYLFLLFPLKSGNTILFAYIQRKFIFLLNSLLICETNYNKFLNKIYPFIRKSKTKSKTKSEMVYNFEWNLFIRSSSTL